MGCMSIPMKYPTAAVSSLALLQKFSQHLECIFNSWLLSGCYQLHFLTIALNDFLHFLIFFSLQNFNATCEVHSGWTNSSNKANMEVRPGKNIFNK